MSLGLTTSYVKPYTEGHFGNRGAVPEGRHLVIEGEWTFRNASISGGELTLWVRICRGISREARLLYPRKLPRQPSAIEAVTGR